MASCLSSGLPGCAREAFVLPEGCPPVEKPVIRTVSACSVPTLLDTHSVSRPFVVDMPDVPMDMGAYCVSVSSKVNSPGGGSASWTSDGDCTTGAYSLVIDVPCPVHVGKGKVRKDATRNPGDPSISVDLDSSSGSCGLSIDASINVPCDLENVSLKAEGHATVTERQSKGCGYSAVISVPCPVSIGKSSSSYTRKPGSSPGVSVRLTNDDCSLGIVSSVNVPCDLENVSIEGRGYARVVQRSSGGDSCGYSAVIDVPCPLAGESASVSVMEGPPGSAGGGTLSFSEACEPSLSIVVPGAKCQLDDISVDVAFSVKGATCEDVSPEEFARAMAMLKRGQYTGDGSVSDDMFAAVMSAAVSAGLMPGGSPTSKGDASNEQRHRLAAAIAYDPGILDSARSSFFRACGSDGEDTSACDELAEDEDGSAFRSAVKTVELAIRGSGDSRPSVHGKLAEGILGIVEGWAADNGLTSESTKSVTRYYVDEDGKEASRRETKTVKKVKWLSVRKALEGGDLPLGDIAELFRGKCNGEDCSFDKLLVLDCPFGGKSTDGPVKFVEWSSSPSEVKSSVSAVRKDDSCELDHVEVVIPEIPGCYVSRTDYSTSKTSGNPSTGKYSEPGFTKQSGSCGVTLNLPGYLSDPYSMVDSWASSVVDGKSRGYRLVKEVVDDGGLVGSALSAIANKNCGVVRSIGDLTGVQALPSGENTGTVIEYIANLRVENVPNVGTCIVYDVMRSSSYLDVQMDAGGNATSLCVKNTTAPKETSKILAVLTSCQ